MTKQRLDTLLFDRKLAPSRTRAQALVAQGMVRVDGVVITRPAQTVAGDCAITVADTAPHWASRAGEKLDHALNSFGLDVGGAVCLDIGASTGGFTDVLLHRGAAQVYAVDVGHGQMLDRLKQDPRVLCIEGLHARDITAAHIPAPPDIIVCDVSFISLTKALPAALALARTGTKLVALIKPQFEVGRAHIGKGGIVKDSAQQTRACDDIRHWLETHQDWRVQDIIDSPITGGDGNREYLLFAGK